jgi:hypothetical protein
MPEEQIRELVNCYAQAQRAFQACTQMQNPQILPQQLLRKNHA